MFNEIKRYAHYRWRYAIDSCCDAVYSLIFVLGIQTIFDPQKPINLLYFFIYYSLTNVNLLANEELEYEIRTNQYLNLKTSSRSLLRVYLARSLAYFVWTSAIFALASLISTILLKKDMVLPDLTPLNLGLILIVNLALFLLLYTLTIHLTERFKRISVCLNLVNTFLLFYSGLVFPAPFISYSDLLNQMLSLF